MANVVLEFKASAGDSEPQNRPVLIVGQLNNLQQANWTQVKGKLQPAVSEKIWQDALSALNPNPTDSCPLYLSHAAVAALPSRVSRHNSPSSAHFLSRLVRTCLPRGTSRCILMVCEQSDVFASACAISRAFPIFSRRSASSRRTEKTQVTVEFITVGEDNGPLTLTVLQEIKAVGTELGITPVIIRGEELKQKGFGGIYGVGKAAVNPPALAVLSHKPDGATQTIAWTNMPGMKRDCGGAAAILGAFKATVKQGFKDNLHAIFCLAENAVGPTATRPDDIHTLYSGKTVEINNTDAEGRLVLSDGVVYASKDLSADIILDMATLTGAQGISTGKYHCAVMTNSEQWETACVRAGRSSGDLAHPLVYCPELHFNEFTSAVADMKNSVAGISTGKYHCAVMTNSEQWETACVRAGRSSGDLAHPLVYCPELHFNEFTSAVADMKNSVAGISTGKYHCAVMTNSEQWETACVRAGRSSGDLAHPLVYCPELHFNEFTSAVADMKNSVAGISTGKYHCAVMTNSEQWETACVRAGRSSGDLAHPLVYCPELHFNEFTSAVADMKNSVAGISTGKYHCAVMTNSEQWETACVRAGRSSGDLAHPLVYCPELHFNEFTSAVADMKNSVAPSH
ncbi:unnamed protein product [Coregonus sp. 'balchen']|nr:unnamed protein product [Coregonus sp. 'balchen']